MNRLLVAAASVLVTVVGCGGPPPPAAPAPATTTPAPVAVEETREVSAIVEGIDVEKRLVALRTDDGETFTVEVGEEVRNLPQVKVGDRVVARYFQAVGARLSTADTPETATVDLAGERAAPGERPAGAIGSRVTIPVTINSIRPDGTAVTFFREDGLLRVLEVKNPAAQEFVRGLKEGDKVEITYTEALAISVEPVEPAS